MNDLPYELFVAIRYLLAKRKQAFISLISFISVIGVGVGVIAVLISLALMTGLQKELRERIVGSSAHVYVFKMGEGMSTSPPRWRSCGRSLASSGSRRRWSARGC
jgi:lipoprotein-releasing system permease protein